MLIWCSKFIYNYLYCVAIYIYIYIYIYTGQLVEAVQVNLTPLISRDAYQETYGQIYIACSSSLGSLAWVAVVVVLRCLDSFQHTQSCSLLTRRLGIRAVAE